VPANRITSIFSGENAVVALLAARHFGTGSAFCLNPRNAHELARAQRAADAKCR
jgi:plasmid maintenance system antidote protein VapI